MNLICKLLGHKWRDTSWWEFKRISGNNVKRKITQWHCERCNETRVIVTGSWQPDE